MLSSFHKAREIKELACSHTGSHGWGQQGAQEMMKAGDPAANGLGSHMVVQYHVAFLLVILGKLLHPQSFQMQKE